MGSGRGVYDMERSLMSGVGYVKRVGGELSLNTSHKTDSGQQTAKRRLSVIRIE